MRILTFIFGLYFALCANAETLSSLPAASTLTGAEVIPCEQGGTRKCTAAQIATYVSTAPATNINFQSETLNPNGSFFNATNSLLYTSGNGGGITLTGIAYTPTTGDNQISPFDIYIAGDTLDTTTSGKNFANWLSVNGSLSTGHTGARNAGSFRISVDGTPTTLGVGYNGLIGILRGNANLGGVTGSGYNGYQGAYFGQNCNVFLTANATALQNTTCEEFDVAVPFGASSAEKRGIDIVQTSTDSVNGVYIDNAIDFSTQNRVSATFTASVGGATSGVATAVLVSGGGTYWFRFSDNEIRQVTIAGDGITCSWSGALNAGTITTAGVFAPWTYGINFGSYAHQSSFWTPSTLIGFSNQVTGGAEPATAGWGVNWSNVTFTNYALLLPGFSVDGSGNTAVRSLSTPSTLSYATEMGSAGIAIAAPNATFTDTAAASSPTYETGYSFGNPTFTSAAAITTTNAETVFLGTPTCAGSMTCTNVWSIFAQGAIHASSVTTTTGATLGGGTVGINNNSSNPTNICTGTCSAAVNIGTGSTDAGAVSLGNTSGGAVNLESVSIQMNGVKWASTTVPTLSGSTWGTGAVLTATSGTKIFKIVAGTTASTTASVGLPTAANDWKCDAKDYTTVADIATPSAEATNSHTWTWSTAPTSGDKILITCDAM